MANIPERCKRCKKKQHSKQLDTIFCVLYFEFNPDCKDFELDKRRQKFQELCSNVMNHRTKQNGWSDFELDVKRNVLEPENMIEGNDFKHNYKMQNEEQTGYYEIDFFLFKLNAILEADGQAWHSDMGHGFEKDERRDTWFRKMGLETHRIKAKSEIEYTAARKWIKQLSREPAQNLKQKQDYELQCPKCGSGRVGSEQVRFEPRVYQCFNCDFESYHKSRFKAAQPKTETRK